MWKFCIINDIDEILGDLGQLVYFPTWTRLINYRIKELTLDHVNSSKPSMVTNVQRLKL